MQFVIQDLVTIAGGCLIWLVAFRLTAPGRDITLWHGIAAAVLARVATHFTWIFFKSQIGQWVYVVNLPVMALVLVLVLRLPFLRSLIVTVLFWIIVTALAYFLPATEGATASLNR
jgi:hypothetical protein